MTIFSLHVSRKLALEDNLALLVGFLERLLATLRNAADVEGPHRQLRAGFTDGLRGDDADGLALFTMVPRAGQRP